MFILAINALGRFVFLQARIIIIMRIIVTEEATRLAFAGFADVSYPVTEIANFNFWNKEEHFVTITTQKDVFWENLSWKFEAHSTRRDELGFTIYSDSFI